MSSEILGEVAGITDPEPRPTAAILRVLLVVLHLAVLIVLTEVPHSKKQQGHFLTFLGLTSTSRPHHSFLLTHCPHLSLEFFLVFHCLTSRVGAFEFPSSDDCLSPSALTLSITFYTCKVFKPPSLCRKSSHICIPRLAISPRC